MQNDYCVEGSSSLSPSALAIACEVCRSACLGAVLRAVNIVCAEEQIDAEARPVDEVGDGTGGDNLLAVPTCSIDWQKF